jgi:uncharacterized protein YaaR (DUF327 family)
MAKISDLISPLFNPALYNKPGADAARAKEKKSVRENRETRFSTILEKAAEELPAEAELPELPDSPEAVTILQDAVHSAGDELARRPFPEEIQRYKRAVRNFLRYVVDKGYTTERQIGIPQYLRPNYRGPHGRPEARERKTYTLIQVVDEKLEQLAAGILTGQTTQMELLARLEEISGILIDLLK